MRSAATAGAAAKPSANNGAAANPSRGKPGAEAIRQSCQTDRRPSSGVETQAPSTLDRAPRKAAAARLDSFRGALLNARAGNETGRVAQRESTPFTRVGSQVQSLSRPPQPRLTRRTVRRDAPSRIAQGGTPCAEPSSFP